MEQDCRLRCVRKRGRASERERQEKHAVCGACHEARSRSEEICWHAVLRARGADEGSAERVQSVCALRLQALGHAKAAQPQLTVGAV
eukprot:2455012-Rhodomonas_salina.2